MARKKPGKKIARAPKAEPVKLVETLPAGYAALLENIKTRVSTAQVKAALSVNRELIQLYWDIGRLIVERQEREGWGKSIVERLAADIQRDFPGIQGFSPVNVWRMRSFFLAYRAPETDLSQAVTELKRENLSQAVTDSASQPPAPIAQIPWGHNQVHLFKLKDGVHRLWYAQQAVLHGWSRAVLTVQIETDLYARQGAAVTNFAATLPAPQSDLAQQAIKDPYIFDFLTLHADAVERDLEQGLIDHVRQFLLELGAGFAFVGQQVHVQVGADDFYLDLLFYQLRLRCFVIVDLKMKGFTPEDAGKMNFYLSTVDEQMRHPQDQPSIGLILCKENNRLIAEYALRDVNKPIGVAEWQTRLVKSLPEHLKGSLPTIAELEAESGE